MSIRVNSATSSRYDTAISSQLKTARILIFNPPPSRSGKLPGRLRLLFGLSCHWGRRQRQQRDGQQTCS